MLMSNTSYVATEEGIFEFSVNIEERQRFPGMAWI